MKLRKLASLFVIGALLMTGCQSSKTDETSKEVSEVVEDKTVVAATVSGTLTPDAFADGSYALCVQGSYGKEITGLSAIFKDSDYNYTMQTRNIQIGKTNE